MLAQIETTKTHLTKIQSELTEQMEIYREVQQTLAKQEAVFERKNVRFINIMKQCNK